MDGIANHFRAKNALDNCRIVRIQSQNFFKG